MGIVIRRDHESRARPGRGQGSFARLAHIRRAIKRYRRDLALMLGKRTPTKGNVDDIAILERFQSNPDQTGLLNEWILRIKTLEGMLELLREERDQTATEPGE